MKGVEQRLQEELTLALQSETGLIREIALPFAAAVMRYLQREYGGGNLYVPMPARKYPRSEIEQRLLQGESPVTVASTNGISRTMLHRMFPGGLPSPLARTRAKAAQ